MKLFANMMFSNCRLFGRAIYRADRIWFFFEEGGNARVRTLEEMGVWIGPRAGGRKTRPRIRATKDEKKPNAKERTISTRLEIPMNDAASVHVSHGPKQLPDDAPRLGFVVGIQNVQVPPLAQVQY